MNLKIITLYALTFFLYWGAPLFADTRLYKVTQKDGHLKYHFLVQSESLSYKQVPVFVYSSNNLNVNKTVRPILFLHGKGFSREVLANDGMLEHMGINQLYLEQGLDNTIFIAPQDIFRHEDSDSKGQDYWIGTDGRSWSDFLGTEMDDFLTEVSRVLDSRNVSELDSVLGVSMGAHGAMMLARHHPERYRNVYGLSPVFRPNINELHKNDWDVFRPLDRKHFERHNIAFQIVSGEYRAPDKLILMVSQTDFGLNPERFPQGVQTWELLENAYNGRHSIHILNDESGHSMRFWRKNFLSLGKSLFQ